MGINYSQYKIFKIKYSSFSGNFHFIFNVYTESEMFLIAVAESENHISEVHFAV